MIDENPNVDYVCIERIDVNKPFILSFKSNILNNTYQSKIIHYSIDYKLNINDSWSTKIGNVVWNYKPTNIETLIFSIESNENKIYIKNFNTDGFNVSNKYNSINIYVNDGLYQIYGNSKSLNTNSINLDNINTPEIDDMTYSELLNQIEELKNEINTLKSQINQNKPVTYNVSYNTSGDSLWESGEGAYSIQMKKQGGIHAIGDCSISLGDHAISYGFASLTEGTMTYAYGRDSHAEGYATKAQGHVSHAEGDNTYAYGEASHAEGQGTISYGQCSHAEGGATYAIGPASHVEGLYSYTYGDASHAEGCNAIAYAEYSHAEGLYSTARGIASHAEGNSFAEGEKSHAEGNGTIAYGEASHSEGLHTIANGEASHTEGNETVAINMYEHAEGMFNKSNENTISSIGIGTSNNRKNAFEVMNNGDIYIYGIGNYDGANPSDALSLQEIIDNLLS